MDKSPIIAVTRKSPSDKCYVCGRTRDEFSKVFFDGIATDVLGKDVPEGARKTYIPEVAFHSFSFTQVTDLQGKTRPRFVVTKARMKKFFMPSKEVEQVVKITMTVHLCPACNAMYSIASQAAYRTIQERYSAMDAGD